MKGHRYGQYRALVLASVFLRELPLSLRRMRRRPSAVVVAIASMAVALASIGLVAGVLLPLLLPVSRLPGEDRLVMGFATSPADCERCLDGFSLREYDRWRAAGLRAFSATGLYRHTTLTPDDRAEPRVAVAFVDEAFTRIMGDVALRGRALTAVDHGSAERTAVVSESFWRNRLGGSTSAVGSEIRLGGKLIRIVGVMPRAFRVPDGVDLWMPSSADAEFTAASVPDKFLVGRLADGWSADQARAALAATARTEALALGADAIGRGATVLGPRDWPGRENEASTVRVIGAAALALILLCLLNVSHVVHLGALARGREFAVRRALGATPVRLGVELLTDIAAMAAIAAVASVSLFAAARRGTVEFVTTAFGVDVSVPSADAFALFVPAIAAVVTLAIGLPALAFVRSRAPGLHAGSGATRAGSHRGFRTFVVVTQVAAVFVVVTGAGVLLQSYRVTRDTTTGFDDDRVVVAPLVVRRGTDAGAEVRAVLLARLAVEANSGGRQVAVWSKTRREIDHFNARRPVLRVEGRGDVYSAPNRNLWDRPYPTTALGVSPQAFDVLGIAIVAGRRFTDADGAGAEPVAIINEAAARHLWPGDDAVGKRLRLGDERSVEPWLTVVGVVENTVYPLSVGVGMKLVSQGREPALLFRPYAQDGTGAATIAVRTEHATEVEALDVDAIVAASLPTGVRLGSIVTPLRRWMGASTQIRRVRITSQLLSVLAIASFIIALLGVYGVADESVRTRARELAVRRALGASDRSVVATIGGRLGRWFGGALVVGALATLGTTVLAERTLYGHGGEAGAIRTGLAFGVSALEPRWYLIALSACGAMLLLGVARPMIHALRVQPAEVLKGVD